MISSEPKFFYLSNKVWLLKNKAIKTQKKTQELILWPWIKQNFLRYDTKNTRQKKNKIIALQIKSFHPSVITPSRSEKKTQRMEY